jgi:hypothetical protein
VWAGQKVISRPSADSFDTRLIITPLQVPSRATRSLRQRKRGKSIIPSFPEAEFSFLARSRCAAQKESKRAAGRQINNCPNCSFQEMICGGFDDYDSLSADIAEFQARKPDANKNPIWPSLHVLQGLRRTIIMKVAGWWTVSPTGMFGGFTKLNV